MDAIRYTVTVNSIPAGWSFSTTHGDVPNPATAVLFGDGLTYHWEFADQQIPGHLEPATAGVTFLCLTAADLPIVDTGDLIRVRVRIGTAGPMLLDDTFRAAEPVVTLQPGKPRAAVMRLELTDTLADYSSRFPTKKAAPILGALATIRDQLTVAIGRPTSWGTNASIFNLGDIFRGSTGDDPNYAGDDPVTYASWGSDSATTLIRKYLNSYAFAGIHHTIVPGYGAAHPAGYEQVRASSNPASLQDPVTDLRFQIAPASRRLTGVMGLPFRLAMDGAVTTIAVDQPFASIARLPVLDAAWCTLPASARKSRDHAVTIVNIEGCEYSFYDTAPYKNAASTERSNPDYATRGAVSRSVQTMQAIVDVTEVDPILAQPKFSAAADRIASVFLPDDTTLAARWSFDAFTVRASLMPQAAAEKLLPMLVRGKATTDLVRHLTIHNIPDDAQLEGRSWVNGFVTSGDLEILGGELTFTLTTAPGMPEVDDQADSITWAAGLASPPFEATTWNTIDPNLTAADFRLVRN